MPVSAELASVTLMPPVPGDAHLRPARRLGDAQLLGGLLDLGGGDAQVGVALHRFGHQRVELRVVEGREPVVLHRARHRLGRRARAWSTSVLPSACARVSSGWGGDCNAQPAGDAARPRRSPTGLAASTMCSAHFSAASGSASRAWPTRA